MPADTGAAGSFAVDMYGVSAGLDMLSGVFGYLNSLNAQSVANSQAQLITAEADANAQRYQEQAAQQEAHEKVMYLASGVTLAGSPVDALATSARIANENAQAIVMGGEVEALNAETGGVNSEIQGRDALVGGLSKGAMATGMGVLAGANGTQFGDLSAASGSIMSASNSVTGIQG